MFEKRNAASQVVSGYICNVWITHKRHRIVIDVRPSHYSTLHEQNVMNVKTLALYIHKA